MTKQKFLIRTILISGPGSKSIILNNSYKIYCLNVHGFGFGPYATRALFCSMDETLDVRLPPWFAISNSALKSNSLKKILTFIEILF